MSNEESWDLVPISMMPVCVEGALQLTYLYDGLSYLWICSGCGDRFATTREALDHVGI